MANKNLRIVPYKKIKGKIVYGKPISVEDFIIKVDKEKKK